MVARARTPGNAQPGVLDGAEPTVADVLALQRHAGNRAVTSLLAARVTRPRRRPAVQKAPSDIDLGFNALDIAHRLVESIDQSQVKYLKEGDPGFVKGVSPFARQIDFNVVHAQLSGLTASQVKEVEARYFDHEKKRSLYVDLLGRGESGVRPNLTVEQIMRLRALLGGTRTEAGEDPGVASENQRQADVYELRGILKGNPKGADIERVMTLLRRTPEEGEKLARLYDGNWNLRADLLRMGYVQGIRAMMLLAGSPLAADAYHIAAHRLQIVEIDKKLAALDPPGVSVTDVIFTVGAVGGSSGALMAHKMSIAALKSQRKVHADAIEERVKLTAEEARNVAEAGGLDVLGVDEAIRSRVSLVLGGDEATVRTVGGTQGKLIGAIARADPSEQAAAELKKLDERGQLTSDVLGQTLRGLRQQAEAEAARLFPDDTADQLAEHTRQLSDRWFIHLRSTWDSLVVGNARTFDQMLDRGDQTEVDYKRTLYMASGKLSDVDELVLALRGKRKDLETVKRVLRNKNHLEIMELKRLYKIKTTTPDDKWGGSLDADLLGYAPSEGKAQGTDRLLLEDYLTRPHEEGGKWEVDYIVRRAEREHKYTIDNRGATGWWRDHWGNEARSLLDATLKEVREKRDRYYALTKDGTDRLAMRSREAKVLIQELHFARATIRGDRAGYEKATAELRATFQAIASFVLQAVLTAVLSPAAAALFRGIHAAAAATRYGIWLKNTVVSMSSTIAANKAVYGNQYTRDMLLADLRGGLGGAIGSAAVGKLVDPIAGRLQSRLGKEMTGEFIEGVKTYGGMQTTAVLEGQGVVAFDEFAKEHFLGKVGEKITGATATGLVQVGYGPGPTHAPYDPDGPGRPIPGTAGAAGRPGAPGAHAGDAKTATEVDVDADPEDAPVRTPMALPPELDKPPPRGRGEAGEQARPSGREHSRVPQKPPRDLDGPEQTPGDAVDPTERTAGTERAARRAAEQARGEQHPRDAESLASSTAPTARQLALAAEFAPLFERFKTMRDVVPRSEAIAKIIRRSLAADGVHPVVIVPGDLGPHYRADFNVETWVITINSQHLARPELSIADFANLIESATHEARHALHHWRGLRAALEPTGGFRPDSRVRPNEDAVAAARAANANSAAEHRWPSEEAKGEALEIYQQTFGRDTAQAGGELNRAQIQHDLSDRQAERDTAEAALDKIPKGSKEHREAVRAFVRADRRFQQAFNRYVAMPQETDAFRRGLAMRAAMMEALIAPRIDAARQAARDAYAEQVAARRQGDSEGALAAKARQDTAVEQAQELQTELDSLPHRTGQQTTHAQDLEFAFELRRQAAADQRRARAAGDQAVADEALARYREASLEIRRIQAAIDDRHRTTR